MKTVLPILAIACGILFPYGHAYSFLIRYVLMFLLLFAFLEIEINKKLVRKSHFVILFVNILLPLLIFFIIKPWNATLASAAFITALGPTAVAATVITSLLRGRVEYVAFSLLLTNALIAILIPFLFPLLLNSDSQISVINILLPVLTVFLIPLITAQSLKMILPKAHAFLSKHKDSSFYLLVIGIYLGTSKASHYISNEFTSSLDIVYLIAVSSFIICILSFIIGKIIGGHTSSQEAGQSLGQKNNAFTIWVALTFISPIAVLGPVFYILFQNSYISWQLYRFQKSNKS